MPPISTGSVSIDPDDFAAFLPCIKQATGAVVNISTGGSLKNTIEERIAPTMRFSPEMCSLNMGSMNFSFHPLAKRYDTWSLTGKKNTSRIPLPIFFATPFAIFRPWRRPCRLTTSSSRMNSTMSGFSIICDFAWTLVYSRCRSSSSSSSAFSAASARKSTISCS